MISSLVDEDIHAVAQRDVMISMRDGVCLATDIYFPANHLERAPQAFPVILERTPYGKSQPSRSERNHRGAQPLARQEVANFFVRRGYIVVYQDCRGRHSSDGEFIKYLSDAEDGYDTCAWLVTQPWCDGNIGMKGLSYAAHTQMAAACAQAPGLRALVVDSGGFSNGYQSGIRQGGAYELKQAAWAVMFAVEQSRKKQDAGFELTSEDLDRWFSRMPWRRGDSPLTPTPDYEDFLFDQWERGVFDDYWKQPGIYAEAHYPQLSGISTVHMSSWYDVYSRTAIENYFGMARHGAICRLIIGPWTHGNRWETFSGDIDFGEAARFDGQVASNFLEFRAQWFDRWLKHNENGVDHQPPVLIFVMGGGTGCKNDQGRLQHGGHWRAEQTWPIPSTQLMKLFLTPTDSLSANSPTDSGNFQEYVFDPRDPVPTIGGSVVSRPPAIFAGGYDQVENAAFFGCKHSSRPLTERHDVLTFQTDPLPADLEVTGDIDVVLWVSSNCPDTDFTAKLIDIYPPSPDYPAGYALNLTDGIIRARYRNSWEEVQWMQENEVCKVHIRLFPTSNLFKRGHRIRLDISSSNFPKFDINPNTGEPEAKATHSRLATNRVYSNKQHMSYVMLPHIPAISTKE